MPAWAGYWRGCARDLYDIEGNLCNGTSILAWYMDRFGGDEKRALPPAFAGLCQISVTLSLAPSCASPLTSNCGIAANSSQL